MQAIYPATSIIRELDNADLEVHVAHPREPTSAYKKVIYHKTRVSGESLGALFNEVKPDLVISTVSGNSFEIQKDIIDSAVQAGVPRFIPYEFGQDSLNEKVQKRLPPNKERARTIEYLKQLSADGKISWVAIATGIDLDRGLLNGNLGFDIKWESATLHGEGTERFAGSSSGWLGRVILAAIQHWQEVENQYIYAAGLTTSGSDVVKAFEKATGREYMISKYDVDELVREAEKRIEQGFPDAGMFLMGRSVMYDEDVGAVHPFEEDDAKKKLGLSGEKLDDIVGWVLHEHQHHNHGGCGCD